MLREKTAYRLTAHIDLSIFEVFDRQLNDVGKNLFAEATKNVTDLSEPFDQLQRAIALEVEIRKRNFSCFSPGAGRTLTGGGTELIVDHTVKYQESLFTSARSARKLFLTSAERSAHDHADKMANNACEQLKSLHAMIIYQLNAELERLKHEKEKAAKNVAERELKLQMTRADMAMPTFVLTEQVMGLKARYEGLLSFSRVLFQCLVHCIMKDQYSARTLLVREVSRSEMAKAVLLTPAEEEYLAAIYALYEAVRTKQLQNAPGNHMYPHRLALIPPTDLLQTVNGFFETRGMQGRFVDRKLDLMEGEESELEKVFLVVEKQHMYVIQANEKQKWNTYHLHGRKGTKDNLKKLAKSTKVRMILSLAPTTTPLHSNGNDFQVVE